MSDDIPEDNLVYKQKTYWDERFSKEEKYDWLTRYDGVKDLLAQYVKRTDRILMIGCGNSTLSQDMYDDGYENITNIDYSDVVIANMSQKNAERTNMTWQVMNMLDMTFEDGVFDVVIDKCAMDALLVDEGDVWDPAEHVKDEVHRLCSHVTRVLKADGKFLQMSFGQPHFRCKYLDHTDRYHWSYRYHTFGGGFGYFFYVMDKAIAAEEGKSDN
eukprot:TRINITY_DN1228_c0_g1_i1.p1 TRINITY_DN1228_c0_g1~~TRINITY_DN1228_c0_g1_i1.p1  ORF type:complete len:231 (-),score=74.87 TRINITY_DN1228_c0_g1_i1:39-683(-)